jgi:hypothetical protein
MYKREYIELLNATLNKDLNEPKPKNFKEYYQ